MQKFFVLFVGLFMVCGTANAGIMSSELTEVLLQKKQNKITAETVKTNNESAAVVSAVKADDGVITVEKSEITLPVGGQTSETRAAIWVM